MKKIFLVDISSFIFRAFYAVRPLSSPSGTPVNAVYGVLSMLIKLLKDERPDFVAICYDRKEPSFRKALAESYKANRSEMPEDLVPQMSLIKQLIDLMGFPAFEAPGFEADDLIGTIAMWARKKQDLEVCIVSGDKDFGQLIEDHILLCDTMKGTRMGPKEAFEKWGVRPDQFIDYLAMVGDSSDNIPGISGIGPKGAVTLLTQFQSLEGIYENLEKVSSASLKSKLENGREAVKLSKTLVTIVTDVPLSQKLEDYRQKPMQNEALRNFLKDLNFKSFEKALFSEAPASESRKESLIVATATEARTEAPESQIETRLPEAEALEITEIAKHFQKNAKIWFSDSERGVFVSDGKVVFELRGTLSDLGPATENLELNWQGHDLKSFWHKIQIHKGKAAWDSMLAGYIIKPGDSVSFDHIYSRSLGAMLPDLPTGSQLIAAQLDLRKVLENQIKEQHAEKIYSDLDLPLVEILYHMEKIGIGLDTTMLKIESEKLASEIAQLEKKIHELADSQFNIASPKQLSQILFEKLKLTAHKKTKTGFSTDTDVLEKLKAEHPIANFLIQYRELTKLKSTYVDALPLMLKEDLRLHTTFNQASTATGRLSSTDPNLQNIPIKTERGARVRKAFVARPGQVLLSVDYSQIELRILAHYSEDQNMIKAFADDLDIHTATASEVFSVSLKDVSSEMRRTAKAVNFGIAYGQGAFGLAETMGIPRGEAQDIIKRYFNRFPGVKDYIENTISKAKENFFVETLAGRKRWMDELKSGNPMIRKFGERAAINAPIQGSASDIVKMAMIEVAQKIKSPMILQVHDELIFEAPRDQIEAERKQIVSIMESVVSLKVRLKANSAVGPNWDEAH